MGVRQLTSATDVLLVEATFPDCSADILFAYWTRAELLERWWPQKAEIDVRVGGNYHLWWPQQDWHLRGTYRVVLPERLLGFTWLWDHDADEDKTRIVEVTFHVLDEGGTRLMLTHALYGDSSDEQDIRINHHLAGWQHFLSRLQNVCLGE